MAAAKFLRRRHILRGASAAGAAGALAALPAPEIGFAEPALPEARGPAGSWVATVTIAGAGAPLPFQALRFTQRGSKSSPCNSNWRGVQSFAFSQCSAHTWAKVAHQVTIFTLCESSPRLT